MRIDLENRWPVYLSLLAALVALFIPWATRETASWAMGETGPIERATALFYLAAALFAAIALVRADGMMRAYAVFWIILSIVSFGEETSWLQHEIGFRTPSSLQARNVQGEFNLHNLEGLHGGKFFGDDVARPALGGLLSAQNIFQFGFVLIFLAVPLLARLPILGRMVNRARLPYPGRRMVTAIWIPIAAMILLAFVTQGMVKDLAAETREMFYAVAFLMFTSTLASRLRSPARRRERVS